MDELGNLIAILSVFVHQVATQGGQDYKLAWLLTSLQEPAWHTIRPLRTPDQIEEDPYSRLADPRWVTACIAHLSDIQKISEKSKQIRRPGKHPPKDKKDNKKNASENP